MSLHRDRHVLDLDHGHCASELSEVLLNLPKSPLSLSCGRVPCYCYSPGGGSCGLWPWTAPVPRKIGRPHRSHIYKRHKKSPVRSSVIQKHDIYLKDIKITYTNKKTVQEETYLSLLAPRLEALASLDLWRNQSPRMGSPLSWVSAATAMQRNHH
jgi:hypothetical protein